VGWLCLGLRVGCGCGWVGFVRFGEWGVEFGIGGAQVLERRWGVGCGLGLDGVREWVGGRRPWVGAVQR